MGRWCLLDDRRGERGLRLVVACARFWRVRTHLTEGRERITAALAMPGAQAPTPARAWALAWAGSLAYLQTDYTATAALAEEALKIARALGLEGRSLAVFALEQLGEVATEIGDYQNAPGLFEEALNLTRELGDRRGMGNILSWDTWPGPRFGSETSYGVAYVPGWSSHPREWAGC